MKKLACRYAIIQFLPYPETGEFANVGIALLCPETGYFGFKLQERRYRRITQFFDRVDGAIYTQTISAFKRELERIREQLREGSATRSGPDYARELFTHLIHPREAILRFGPMRVLLTESPTQAVDKLFGFYVEHDFVTQDYQERELEQRVKRLLNGVDLPRPFRPYKVGNEDLSVQFQLVQLDGGQPNKIIKPFYLAQDESNKILSHGGVWVDKIKRLRRRHLLPADVMFTVKGPERASDRRFAAFQEICADLQEFQIAVVPAAEEQRILDFAIQ